MIPHPVPHLVPADRPYTRPRICEIQIPVAFTYCISYHSRWSSSDRPTTLIFVKFGSAYRLHFERAPLLNHYSPMPITGKRCAGTIVTNFIITGYSSGDSTCVYQPTLSSFGVRRGPGKNTPERRTPDNHLTGPPVFPRDIVEEKRRR